MVDDIKRCAYCNMLFVTVDKHFCGEGELALLGASKNISEREKTIKMGWYESKFKKEKRVL